MSEGARFRSIFAEFLGDGIFNSDGEQWRSQRKIASHMFSAAKLNSCMLDTFVDRSATVLDLLFEQLDRQNAAAAASPAGPVPHLDFQALMHGYNMDSIMQIGFGLQLDSMRASTPPAFVAAFDRLQENIVYRFLGPPLKWRLLRCLGIGREKEVARALPVIDEFVYSLVRARKENADKYVDSGDLLSLFVASDAKAKMAAAAKADATGSVADATGAAADAHAQPVSGEDAAASSGLSDRELRDIILNFMLVRTHARTHTPHTQHGRSLRRALVLLFTHQATVTTRTHIHIPLSLFLHVGTNCLSVGSSHFALCFSASFVPSVSLSSFIRPVATRRHRC